MTTRINSQEDVKQLATLDVSSLMVKGDKAIAEMRDVVRGANIYFTATGKMTKHEKDGIIIDLSDTGKVAASSLEAIKKPTLEDGTPLERMFADMSDQAKTEFNKTCSILADKLDQAARMVDSVAEAKAEDEIRAAGKMDLFQLTRSSGNGALAAQSFIEAMKQAEKNSGKAPASAWHQFRNHQTVKMFQGADPSSPIQQNATLKLDADPQEWLQSSTALNPSAGPMMATLDRSNFEPETTRSGLIVMEPIVMPSILDYLRVIRISQENYRYGVETVTDAAATLAQGDLLGETGIDVAFRDVPVRNIGHIIKTSDTHLQDEPMMMDLINMELPSRIRVLMAKQVIMGTGTGTNLTGLNAQTGLQARARATGEDAYDAIGEAIKLACSSAAGAELGEPNLVVMHKDNFWDLATAKGTDGHYINANPSMPIPMRVWGLPIAGYNGVPAGTAFVGDFANFARLIMRREIMIDIGWVSDQFQRLQRSIRGYVRCAFVVTRPQAFCKITGLSTR